MDIEKRSKYAEYIAEAIRFAEKETGLKWPQETIVVAKSYSYLSTIDQIIGMPIYSMDMPSSFDFFVAFPSQFEEQRKLQKSFLEYQESFPFDE